jgi:hypothetical protein
MLSLKHSGKEKNKQTETPPDMCMSAPGQSAKGKPIISFKRWDGQGEVGRLTQQSLVLISEAGADISRL